MIPIYDQAGRQWAAINVKNAHDMHTGALIFWIWGRHLFTWKGDHVGFIEDGWLRDHDGHRVGFTPEATGDLPSPLHDAAAPDYAIAPDSWPKRGPLPTVPEFSESWALLDGRSWFTTFITADGETRDNAAELWRAARDRVAASLGETGADEGAADSVTDDADLVVDEGALADLNEAVAAYRAQLDSGDAEALALARVDLHAAAEKYAIKCGAALSA